MARKLFERSVKTTVKKRTVLEFKIHVNMEEYKQVHASSGNALHFHPSEDWQLSGPCDLCYFRGDNSFPLRHQLPL
ncbi:hypothetical protein NC653_018912 [Populus alba x Populus x berolinensis]|uniref:Uncharacterized protein n=1 Tax=Populus alba x Populus x berolinensis TaxID=444605 RepID=A0AAD6QHI3_9ROSI|nr:hypothetical protein NC653_018911 [Populus alba x Populus x berolinensis]KAJ6990495.1 hypothetical protein NC653_018912 [Populus alba x Populus x berolinensis]